MRVSFGLSLIAVLAFSSIALSQGRREERREERAASATRPVAAEGSHGTADQQIAACLYAANRNEVEISRLAEEKSQNEQVRAFAALMVKAHTHAMQKLQQAAGPLVHSHATGTPAAGVRRLEEREERLKVREERVEERVKDREEGRAAVPRTTKKEVIEDKDSPVAAPAAAGTANEGRIARRDNANVLDWVAIHQQVADECLASAKAELQKKEGAEFDHCYIGGQIMAHMKVLDELKVVQNYVSAEMKKDLTESMRMTENHLEQAKKIAEGLQGADESKRVSRKPKAE